MLASSHLLIIQLLLFFQMGFAPFKNTPGTDLLGNPTLEETENVNEIDFRFSLHDREMKITGKFKIKADIHCAKFVTYDFDHKKKYTLGATALELDKRGSDWYQVNFIVEKYFFAKVKALYRYSMDEQNNQINFFLKSNEVNIESFDILESSVGHFNFVENKGMIDINYQLVYKIKPTIFLKSLYNIQKKETINFLTEYKSYLAKNCIKSI